MIKRDISHWTISNSNGKIALLLFAQSLEEILAPYSHDSYRVPALNFHYICHEIANVIELIEENVLDKGNIIPLLAEMKELFLHDEIAQSILGNNFNSLFAKKNAKGEFEQRPLKIDSSKEVDDALPVLKRGINLILGELNRKDQYYKKLIATIKKQISCCNDDLLKLDSLRTLSKIFASELVNEGYSKYYIYDCVKNKFFSSDIQITSLDDIDAFFGCFSGEESDYCVYLPLNSLKQKKAIESFGPFKIEENIFEMFDVRIPYILRYDCTAYDPYRAREDALQLINFCLSVNQFIKHTNHDFDSKYADVVDIKTHEVTFIKRPEPLIIRGASPCESLNVKELITTCLNLRGGAFQVLQLHSSALLSKNNDNQLINLWTALEIAVPVNRKDGLSRINQISNALTASLSLNYIAILGEQLLLDIKSAAPDAMQLIEKVDYGDEPISKLVALIVLRKHQQEFDDLLQELIHTAPLLSCRMVRYKNAWSNTKALKNFYLSHTTRVSQQIMRIYRTRNMLVHDGSSLPYEGYVLQNLHYYVDLYVKFLNHSYHQGYRSISLIIDAAQFQEQLYLDQLSQECELCEENIPEFIFRGLT